MYTKHNIILFYGIFVVVVVAIFGMTFFGVHVLLEEGYGFVCGIV
jgi:hypothetical protein